MITMELECARCGARATGEVRSVELVHGVVDKQRTEVIVDTALLRGCCGPWRRDFAAAKGDYHLFVPADVAEADDETIDDFVARVHADADADADASDRWEADYDKRAELQRAIETATAALVACCPSDDVEYVSSVMAALMLRCHAILKGVIQ